MAVRGNIPVALLRSFIAVAETGRMTRAASVVHLTQSAVSQHIARLEAMLGLALFERHRDAARLTPDGERLKLRALRMIALNDQILSELDPTAFEGEVRLGVPHDIVGALLPPILRVFTQQHPHVLVTLVSDTSRNLLRLLGARKLDLALTTDEQPAAPPDHLLTDHLVWAGARDGCAWERRPLSVAIGDESCGFREVAIAALERAGIAWRAICQVGSLEPVFATLEADMAIAPFLAKTVPPHLTVVEDQQLPRLPRFHLNLHWPRGEREESVREFARHIGGGLRSRFG